MAEMLLKAKDLYLDGIRDYMNGSVLYWAVQAGCEDVVRWVAEHSQITNLVDHISGPGGPITALSVAARNGNEAMVRLLLKLGVSLSANKLAKYMSWAIAEGHAEVVALLVERGVVVNQAHKHFFLDDKAEFPLHQACDTGNADALEILLASNADVYALTDTGQSAVHKAASKGHEKVLHVLIAHGASIDSADKRGYTSLHEAAQNGHTSCVQALLARDANVSAFTYTEFGQNPLHLASLHGHKSVVEALLHEGAEHARSTSFDASSWTALAQSINSACRLPVNSFNVDVTDKCGFTALMLASSNNHHSVGNRLLRAGANVEARCYGGKTALILAVELGAVTCVRALLDAGAYPDARNDAGLTVLHVAFCVARCHDFTQRVDLLELLLRAGANKESRDTYGCTVLHRAAMLRNVLCTALLLRWGANEFVSNHSGHAPRDFFPAFDWDGVMRLSTEDQSANHYHQLYLQQKSHGMLHAI